MFIASNILFQFYFQLWLFLPQHRNKNMLVLSNLINRHQRQRGPRYICKLDFLIVVWGFIEIKLIIFTIVCFKQLLSLFPSIIITNEHTLNLLQFLSCLFNFRQFIPKNRKIVIDFDEINWNDQSQLPTSPIANIISTSMNNLAISEGLAKNLDMEQLDSA